MNRVTVLEDDDGEGGVEGDAPIPGQMEETLLNELSKKVEASGILNGQFNSNVDYPYILAY